MTDKNLVNYIKNSRAQGASDETIKEVLLGNGWQEQQIKGAFDFINLENMSGVPIPQPLTPGTSSVSPGEMKPAESKKATVSRPKTTSPYSLILAILLFISLAILMNKTIDDAVNYFVPGYSSYYGDIPGHASDNITTRLTVDALIVVPFWFITFLMYYFYREKKERLMVLLLPYYITSGWLLIWLLFQVGLVLLNANATFGVYFVLILMGVVLTGVVWAIQRYRNINK